MIRIEGWFNDFEQQQNLFNLKTERQNYKLIQNQPLEFGTKINENLKTKLF